MAATGRCHRGRARYAVRGEAFGVIICHGRDCQQMHGNANAWVAVAASSVTFESDTTLSRTPQARRRSAASARAATGGCSSARRRAGGR